MERWATSPQWKDKAQFLCVCVDSKGVALMFHRDMRFHNVINSWIPGNNYMPVGYGQLGCSGFIVSDKDGNFVSRRTAAYLDYGDRAFRQVESMLSELVAKDDEGETESKTNKRSK